MSLLIVFHFLLPLPTSLSLHHFLLRYSLFVIFFAKHTHMKAEGKTVNEILINLPEDRIEPFNKLHDVIVKRIDGGADHAGRYLCGELLQLDQIGHELPS